MPQAPPPPKGWDRKTGGTQVHHDGEVHNEHKKHEGKLPTVIPPPPTPGLQPREDSWVET